jgi:hypothetical protein
MSVDKHTGAGGDLGYLSKGNMPVEFEDVVFRMEVGDISDIVESEFGYHIVQLTDVRAALNELPFEAVAPEISRELLLKKREAVYDSLLTALRAQATIDVVDPDLQYAIELADSLATVRAAEAAGNGGAFIRAVPEPREVSAEPAPVARDTAVADTLDGE